MDRKQIEKRQNARVFFSEEDNIQAIIEYSANETQKIPVVIMNISAGGLSFIAERYKSHKLNEDDYLTITSINTPPPLGIVEKVEVQVKYKLDFQNGMGVFYGCQFMNITEKLGKKIDKFVHLKLKNLDNESLNIK